MQHEPKKIALIADELLTLLLRKGTGSIDLKITREGKVTELIITQYACEYSDRFVNNMRRNLESHRQSEIEGYYWQLVGDDDHGDELSLVGTMVDESEVSYQEGVLQIRLRRKDLH